MIKKAPVLSVPRLKLEDSPNVRAYGRNPVLIAIDASFVAERALPWALALAKLWNAPLRLVHVRNPIEDAHQMDLCLIDNGTSLSVRSRTGAYLENMAESLSAEQDVSVYSKTVTGVAIADTLRSMCERDAPRALVMARPRRFNLARVLAGSVTNRLMENLPAPLLLVPADSRSESADLASPRELKRLLVHLDGSDASERVVDHVLGMASEDTLCHLRRVVPLASLYSARRGAFSDASDTRDEAWGELFHARDKLEQHGIRCTTRVICDGHHPASAIVAEAKAMRALVVVAASQKHLLPSWLRSHVAENIVRRAEVPVMIVPRFGRIEPTFRSSPQESIE